KPWSISMARSTTTRTRSPWELRERGGDIHDRQPVTRGELQDRRQLAFPRRCYLKMLTARATISATVTMEMADCTVMASLAQRDSGITSVGLNADALVKAR